MLDAGDAFQFLFQKPVCIHKNGLLHRRNNFRPIRLTKLRPLGANHSGIRTVQSGGNIGDE